MNARDDPDFAGRIELRSKPAGQSGIRVDQLLVGWVVVYFTNFVVPLLLGLSTTERAGRFGMFLAIVVWLGLGCWVVVNRRKIGRALVIGGGIVAASQFFPALQLFAGAYALGVVGNLEGSGNSHSLTTEFGGFAATLITGGFLIGVALALGLPILWFTSRGVREAEEYGRTP